MERHGRRTVFENFRIVVYPPMGNAYSTLIKGFPPIEEPDSPEVHGALDAMQDVVGGNIECLYDLGRNDLATGDRIIDFWCNDEFLYQPDMIFNRVVNQGGGQARIMGQMFACASTPKDGESRSLTEEEAVALLDDRYLSFPHLLSPCESDLERLALNIFSDAWGDEYRDFLGRLPDPIKALNGIPTDVDAFNRLIPAPILGKPQDIVAFGWRAHIVYHDDPVHGIFHRRHAAAPAVEFYRLYDGKPLGNFEGRFPIDKASEPETYKHLQNQGMSHQAHGAVTDFIDRARAVWEREAGEIEREDRARKSPLTALEEQCSQTQEPAVAPVSSIEKGR